MKQFEALCEEEFCGVMLKKLDKKKERYGNVTSAILCTITDAYTRTCICGTVCVWMYVIRITECHCLI